jgi:hypothetical protein
MPKASRTTASEAFELEGYEGHFEDFGQYTVGFESYTADADLAPLFAGLPDDRCQCPHMGYVVEGKVKFTFADGHEEVYEAGDAYYARPATCPTCTQAPRSSSSARRPSSGRRSRWSSAT